MIPVDHKKGMRIINEGQIMNAKKPQSSAVLLHLLVALILLIALLPVKAQMTSQHFGLPASTLDSGGGRQGSGHFDLQNSMGQPLPPGIARSTHFGLFTGLQSCTVEEFVLLKGQRGDVDNNGNINVLDILAVANHILGIVILTGEACDRADCDGNGTINILDALGIANVILGIFPACPGGMRAIPVLPEAMELLESLKQHFPPQDFAALMDMAKELQMPDRYALEQNYPNPFNPRTTISYSLPVQSGEFRVKGGENALNSKLLTLHVALKVYNILGQEVATLVDEAQEPGCYSVSWDASDAASGVYFYQLVVNGEQWSETRKMVLMK